MEIERKFFVKEVPFNLNNFESFEIVQAYISSSPVIRIRQFGENYFLTCKGKGRLIRDEWEIEISKKDFKNLWLKIEDNIIYKTRYIIPLSDAKNAELDIFHENLEGFYIVEVEFDSVDESRKFIPPDWFDQELTFVKGFSNNKLRNLSKKNAKQILENLKS